MKIKLVFILSLIIILNSGISYGNNLNINGTSAILIDSMSGRVLYKLNPYIRLPMASTTKIMTALIALENGKLNDKVNIEKECVGIEGSSIYLYEGEKITLEDLLYGLMLRSGNDAAIAIANFIGGTVDHFIVLMNKKAKEIGALNTNFTNPHGLSNDNHYTTAYDLAIITREAFKNSNFRKIVGTQLWTSGRDKNKYFYNKNKVLWQYEGGNGVKTGYTKIAGRCLVGGAKRKNMQLIAVVLNDSNWFNDCYELFDYGFNNYSSKIIYDSGQYIDSVNVINGNKNKIPIITGDKFIYPLAENEKNNIKVFYDMPTEIEAPIVKGEKIGNISVYLNGKLIHSEKLISKENINKLNVLEKIIREFKEKSN